MYSAKRQTSQQPQQGTVMEPEKKFTFLLN